MESPRDGQTFLIEKILHSVSKRRSCKTPERPTQGSTDISQEKGREVETMEQAINVISM